MAQGIQTPPSDGRRVRWRLVIIGIGLLGITVLWTVGWVLNYWSQSQYVSVEAHVTSKNCHELNSGGGYDVAGGNSVCDVRLLYTAPDGTFEASQFSGVDGWLIRGREGQQHLLIYFANHSSEIPISPQDIVPVGATVVLLAVGIAVGVGGGLCVRAGFRRKAPARSGNMVNYSQQVMPVFEQRIRGYDQRQVNEFLRHLAVNPELAVPAFDQRLRGYFTEEVDAYIAFFKNQPQR